MKEKTMHLCHFCAELYSQAYELFEITRLPGMTDSPKSQPCDACGKKVIGTYYKVKKGKSE